MERWRLDIIRGLPLADGTSTTGIFGVDDASRRCICAQLIATESSDAVCTALRSAVAAHGAPGHLVTDYASTFGGGDDAARHQTPFDDVCNEYGIDHLRTRRRRPSGMVDIERFHARMIDEITCSTGPFANMQAAQQRIDSWVADYNANLAANG